MTENQKAAFLTLLADDDPAIVSAIKERLLKSSLADAAWLEPSTRSDDPLLRRRTREVLSELGRKAGDRRFLAFCQNQAEGIPIEQSSHGVDEQARYGDAARLEDGMWMLAQTCFPSINTEGYRALLDEYALELQRLLPPGAAGSQLLAALNELLFQKLGFHGNEKDYYDPENSYLNRVIDRRTGNPISLCVVYFLVARRLGIPITGIGMPGHFVCRYQTPSEEIYIDCFNKGKLLMKADCVRFLMQSSAGFQDGFLAATTPRQVLLRVCTNLHQIYAHHGIPDETTRVQRYIVALAK